MDELEPARTREVATMRDMTGGRSKLHHVAFYYGTGQHNIDAAEMFRDYDIPDEAGPDRHGITQGQFLYVFEPGGNRIELFGEAGFCTSIRPPRRRPGRCRTSTPAWPSACPSPGRLTSPTSTESALAGPAHRDLRALRAGRTGADRGGRASPGCSRALLGRRAPEFTAAMSWTPVSSRFELPPRPHNANPLVQPQSRW